MLFVGYWGKRNLDNVLAKAFKKKNKQKPKTKSLTKDHIFLRNWVRGRLQLEDKEYKENRNS